LIEIQNLFRNESWNVMVSKDDFSWNKQLTLISFQKKKINTPRTTLRFIEFVAKISVLNSKLLVDD
jgi:hypothetical protein